MPLAPHIPHEPGVTRLLDLVEPAPLYAGPTKLVCVNSVTCGTDSMREVGLRALIDVAKGAGGMRVGETVTVVRAWRCERCHYVELYMPDVADSEVDHGG